MSDGNKISNRQRGQEIANQAWKGVKDSAKWGGKKVVSGVKTTASAVKTVVTTPPKAAWNATKAVGNAIHKTGVGVGRGARDGAYSAIGATEKGLEKIGEAEDKAAKYVDKKVGQNAVAQKLTSGVMAMDEGAYRGKEAIKSGVKKAGSAIGNQYNASLIEGDNLGDNLIDFAAKIPGVKKVVIKTKELADAAGITRAINALNNSKIGKGMIKIGEVQAAGIGTGVRAGKATLRVLGVVKDLFKSGAFKTYSALESAIQKTGLTKLLKASSKELATEDGEGKVKPKKGSISERASNLLGKLKAAGKKFPGVEALLNWFKGVDESDFPVEFEEGGFRFKKDAQYYTNELGDLNFNYK